MRYGSVCSGIEAASCAWLPLGWECQWVSEIDPFCNAVIDYRFPKVKNYGDFRTIGPDSPAVDLIIGGTPCQSFSIAGHREGVDDPRGNLALEYIRLIDRLRPRWFIWENVPGVLSSGKGQDFKQITDIVGQCGYGWAYRVLDARYFGVPQRRRRVFLIGCLGDWRPPVAVLFERESMSRYSTKITRSQQGLTGNAHENAFVRNNDESNGVAVHARSKNAHGQRLDAESETFIPIAIQHAMLGRKPEAGPQGPGWRDDGLAFTLDSRTDTDAIMEGMAVRRLTPLETERLQGLPDNHTLVAYRGKMATDGHRYKAVGNSMAVPVIRWLGMRIQAVDTILTQIQQGEITAPPVPKLSIPAKHTRMPKVKPRFIDPDQLSFFDL